MKIGFFDSGMGGVTIFKESLNITKAEYIYLADNLNAPYGNQDKGILKKYIINAIEILVNEGCKIVVIACNTATMVSIEDIRSKYKDLKIIGTEPAIKPAKEYVNKVKGKTLVVATSVTLKEDKFLNHLNKLNFNKEDITLISLNKLVKLVEEEKINKEQVLKYLKRRFSNINNLEYTAIVLGCTHFPIVKDIFKELFPNAKIFDPSIGVSNYLNNQIEKEDDNTSIKVILTKQDKRFKNKLIKLINR